MTVIPSVGVAYARNVNKRFTTVETSMLLVTKRSGGVEPFSRDKVISGVRKAYQGRPVREEDLKLLGQKVEEDLAPEALPKSPQMKWAKPS